MINPAKYNFPECKPGNLAKHYRPPTISFTGNEDPLETISPGAYFRRFENPE